MLSLSRQLEKPLINYVQDPTADTSDTAELNIKKVIRAEDAARLAIKPLLSVGLLKKDFQPDKTYSEDESNLAINSNSAFSVSKFLNRILGTEVNMQSMLFNYFTKTLKAVISDAKKRGLYGNCMVELDSKKWPIRTLANSSWKINFTDNVYTNSAQKMKKNKKEELGLIAEKIVNSHLVELVSLEIDKGMDFESALEMYEFRRKLAPEGFYLSKSECEGTWGWWV